VVSYSGLLYLAKYANPGYNPTVSTYYWARYDCNSLSAAPVCSSTVSNWTQGLPYAASAVVSYNSSLYIAKYANPGYNPTTSTYYWATYTCSSGAPTCSNPIAAWVQGQNYAAGAVVSYQGLQYVAKYANPGYNPTVSTYYWAPVGSWVQGKSYAAGSVVTYSGSTYKAKYANPGYNPTISTYYWSKLGC
jgi:chitodextrinase